MDKILQKNDTIEMMFWEIDASVRSHDPLSTLHLVSTNFEDKIFIRG